MSAPADTSPDTSPVPRFSAVVLDVDSTLCDIEGIDWLARRRGAAVAEAVAELTARSMAGEVALDAVYGERLALVRPTAAEVAALADAYVAALAPGAREAVAQLRTAGVRLLLVSGGLREAILPVARQLGFADGDVHAVPVRFTAAGDFDALAPSPLTTQAGKATVVRALALPAPALAVGDGATDLALRPVVSAFAAFTGFVRREAVVREADHVLASFDDLLELVLR